MRTVLLIGVGAGDPDYVTVQAVKALNRVDVFFVIEKGAEKDDLIELRRRILSDHVPGGGYRVVEARDPERERVGLDGVAYRATIEQWHEDRTDIYERLVGGLGDGEVGAFLVWGDPALYDGTMRILDRVTARGSVAFETEVIPGVSAISALTAGHRIPLNRIGEPIHITTGRRLGAALVDGALPEGFDNIVVMLDGDLTFTKLSEPDVTIYWGAYLGTADEILVAGPVLKVAGEIESVRAEARARKGWIMDTYLLRRG
ncbi:precorrin-6A synthase (deacetylating) [Spongisporangium articulatum]|uniref:Precorrin-6A synthase (Deacetylating) n=1 Tax=Spongisporangium articulatum TaxID=3362603 RepID=A0ABW8AKJ2_9ACTN